MAAKKAPPRKKAPAKKTPARKAPAKKATPYRTDVHGLRVGTDLSIVAKILVKGGKERRELLAKIRSALPESETSGGAEKNYSSIMSLVIKMLVDRGYKVESHWRLVPPASVQKEMEQDRAKRARKKS